MSAGAGDLKYIVQRIGKKPSDGKPCYMAPMEFDTLGEAMACGNDLRKVWNVVKVEERRVIAKWQKGSGKADWIADWIDEKGWEK